jgi:hypothetical protein
LLHPDLGGKVMATKITRKVLVSYLNCKTKAHLKLAGQQVSKSDYEALLASTRQEVRGQVPDDPGQLKVRRVASAR